MKQKNYFSIVRATLLVLLGMLLVPSSLRAETKTITYDFAAFAASQQYYAGNTSVSMGASYSGISGAQVGNTVTYRPNNTTTVDISRVAFVYNSSAAYNTTNESGLYLYAERIGNPWYRGLYNGNWQNNQLAVLHLIPTDKVTINYAGGSNCIGSNGNGNANIHVENESVAGWGTQIGKGQTASKTVEIDFLGDLIISVNQGTMIQSITIETSIAEYEITEDKANKTSTFEFTSEGLINQNDFAVEYLSVSFGNANDYLTVKKSAGQYQSSMYNSETGSENLVTGGYNYQPSGGNFYAFKPTASGSITVQGGMHGTCIHLFIYDIADNGWVTDGTHFYHDTYNQSSTHLHSITFPVTKGRIYYICQDNTNQEEVQNENAFHLWKFTFNRTFNVENLGVVIDDVDNQPDAISVTRIENPGGTGGQSVSVKRCTGNISPNINGWIQNGWIYMSKPTFTDGTDHAGTVILDVVTDNGEATIAVTFPYHADFGVDPENPNRTLGHTWNFIDPRNSDSNFANCWYKEGLSAYANGTVSGILSIGQYNNTGSQFRHETDNREWTYSRRVEGTNGTIHDPYYMNTFDMVGDNADMMWETEGLLFNTETNLSIIYNESDAYDQSVTNPVKFATGLNSDPDRFVGLLPDADGKSSFTIPSLKDGDRVLIFMKSGIKLSDDDNDHGIFLKIHGAKDALGQSINSSDLYKAGGTNYIGGNGHTRYEGCYHFIKEGNGDMTFDMVGGSMCKLLYIRIYSGERISTNDVLSNKVIDGQNVGGNLLFMNDKGATEGAKSQLALHYNGKVQHSAFQVLTYSGNLSDDSFSGDNFVQSGTYEQLLDFTSTVGEIGMFRLRVKDLEFNKKYVGDFCDRNFTVGYRDKVDSYPYTWDFTDIKRCSNTAMGNEANNYPISAAANDLYGNQWDISLFDANGYMKLNTGFDPAGNNHIFDANKIGFGNQLWAGGDVIPETRGLWFYTDDNQTLYNNCLQITNEGIRFCNTASVEGHEPWWNYKMVVPSVPADGAVYLRMKRDPSVSETDKQYSSKDGKNVLFLNTRFAWGTDSKTSLTEDTQDVYLTQENGSNYSFYKVDGTTDEYIVAVKNTTGDVNHLQFTLNGWTLEKLAVSTDAKTIGSTGFATESRDHAIDHSLTGYMVGKNITAYVVTSATASSNSTDGSLTAVEVTGILPAGQGCFLVNNPSADYDEDADNSVKILNNKTNLFVADMHDTNQMTSNNLMKAMVNGGTIAQESDGNINYVLASSHQSASTGVVTEKDKVAFYRAAKNGGASVPANGAYLAVPKAVSNSVKAFYMIYDYPEEPLSEDYGDQDVTSISLQEAADVNAVWYNMNGQKLNGKPAKGGVYIMNGKKVVIK